MSGRRARRKRHRSVVPDPERGACEWCNCVHISRYCEEACAMYRRSIGHDVRRQVARVRSVARVERLKLRWLHFLTALGFSGQSPRRLGR